MDPRLRGVLHRVVKQLKKTRKDVASLAKSQKAVAEGQVKLEKQMASLKGRVTKLEKAE